MACCCRDRSTTRTRIGGSCTLRLRCAKAAADGIADFSAPLRDSSGERHKDHFDTRVDRLKACVFVSSSSRVPAELPAFFPFPRCDSKGVSCTPGKRWQILALTFEKSTFPGFNSKMRFSSSQYFASSATKARDKGLSSGTK